MESIKSNIKRASVEMILLALLSNEDKYGYQMAQEMKALSEGKLTLLEGSMYPILYRLTDSGDIEAYEKQVGRRLTRVYYHLTDKGHDKMAELLRSFRDHVAIVEHIVDECGIDSKKKKK